MMDSLFPINFSYSMLSDLWQCEMFWFRKHAQRLTGMYRSGDLIAGGLFASACEITRKSYFNEGLDEETAIELGYEHILCGEDTTDDLKTNERMAYTFKKYFKKFRLESTLTPCKLVDGSHAVEYSFVFDTGIPHPEIEGQNIYFKGKLDGLYERLHQGKGIKRYVLDEKTTKSVRRITGTKLIDMVAEEDEYRTSGQFIGYCLTPEHEVLTKDGWVSIASLEENKEVMCWDDGNLDWDTPYSYIKQEYIGDLISYEGQISITGTPDHRQVVRNRKNKKYETYTLDSLPTNIDQHQFITGGILSSKDEGEENKYLIKLLVAAQADGCWAKDSKYNRLVWNFSKQRKIDRLEGILNKLNVEYTKNTYSSSHYSTGSYTTIRLIDTELNNIIYDIIGQDKVFSSWFLRLPYKSMLVFIEELCYWDGYVNKGNIVYCSCNKTNVDLVQTIASLIGKLGNVQINQNSKKNEKHSECYEVYITNNIHKAVTRHSKALVPYDGFVYCINVNSSYFLTRYKGRIVVTGNCWAAKQLGINVNSTLIRRVPIGVNFEEAYEIEIPITDFMIENWVKTTFTKIEELVEKYKWIKATDKAIPQDAFYPVYNSNCNSYRKLCVFADGCIEKYGEQILASRYQQVVFHEGKEHTLKEFKQLKGLI